MKIAELLESYSKLDKNSAKRRSTKTAAEKLAFIPNPQVPQPGQPQQGQPQQGQPQQGQPPQQDPAQMAAMQGGQPPQGQPPQGQPPQGQPPQQDPAQMAAMQGGQPPQGQPPQGGEESQLMQEIMTAVQQLPPQVQQQVIPLIQQLMAMPPQEREQHLQELLQQMTAMQGGGQPPQGDPSQMAAMQGGQPPQGGMEAQAADEDLFAAAQQGGGMDPSAQGGEGGADMSALLGAAQQDPAAQDADNAESSAIEAKNELDNVRVSLTVRELLDLTSKGTATASLLKVKQLADSHKQKMEQTRQKAEADQKQQAQEQTAQQNSMMGGGIYPSPMEGAQQ